MKKKPFLKFDRCKKKFHAQCESIQHENETNLWNLEVSYNRGSFIKDTNLEDAKLLETKTAEDIKKCRLLWLKGKDPDLYLKAVEFFKERTKKLNYILSSADEQAKSDLTRYWNISNSLINFLGGYKKIEIKRAKKIESSSLQDTYVAITEEGIIVLED
jgi:hypothetical protein